MAQQTSTTGTYHSLRWQNTKQEHTIAWGVSPYQLGCEHTSLGREHIITTCTGWGGHIPQFGMGTYQIPEI